MTPAYILDLRSYPDLEGPVGSIGLQQDFFASSAWYVDLREFDWFLDPMHALFKFFLFFFWMVQTIKIVRSGIA